MSVSITMSGLEEAIVAGDLETLRNLYATASTDQQSALLTSIAERAARNAKTEILDWCFRSGLEVSRNSLNNELYDQACFSLSPAVFDVLIAHGIDINRYHSEYVGDALSLAAYHGNVEFARFLLQKGADPNETWGYQEHEAGIWAIKNSTAHIAAAELGNIEALRLLVEANHGADLEYSEPWWGVPSENEGNQYGTALYRAALKGKDEVVAYLLEKGANPKFKDKMGRSCFWAAREGGNERAMKLLEGSD
ncbi:ankyrin repeat-containing domain protein [Xylaria grammica]|nr:ankyrin repeat-containing domain protein [Xylaria grammica]